MSLSSTCILYIYFFHFSKLLGMRCHSKKSCLQRKTAWDMLSLAHGSRNMGLHFFFFMQSRKTRQVLALSFEEQGWNWVRSSQVVDIWMQNNMSECLLCVKYHQVEHRMLKKRECILSRSNSSCKKKYASQW